MFNHTRSRTGSRSHASPRLRRQGHRLGGGYNDHRASQGGGREARHTHQSRGHPAVHVTHVFGNHMQHNPMHALTEAMRSLDRTLSGGQQSHGSGIGISFGPGFPFDQCGRNPVPDISGLCISGFEESFSHPIFAGRYSQSSHNQSEFVPPRRPSNGRARRPSNGSRPTQHHPYHTIHPGFQPGDYLPFDVHPNELQQDLYDFFPIEFEPPPLEEDMGPTESSEQRINRFIAQHTEPLTAANTTSTTNYDCPICIENASAHSCVKIKGIAGCEHMIGRDCLKELLSRRPDDEKTCPLCRAVWLPENGVWQDSEQWRGLAGRAAQGIPSSSRDRMQRGMEQLTDMFGRMHSRNRRHHN